ncbi:MAG: ribonuclease T2 [Bryobacteraceae bacterium]|nr:ribonuclease T2 [Bryobacteraceae bacterium]
MRRAILFVLSITALAGQPRQSPPGQFDFYVLSLSWSPDYCASPAGARDRFQCAGPRRYGFVVHGLWPQFERGWPADCTTDPLNLPGQLRRDILEIMPSERLMNHEWRKHGTCSGLSAKQYFESILSIWANVRIPPELKSLTKAEVEFSPADLERRFVAANPGLQPNMIAVDCGGRFLKEVQVCFDKNLRFRACSAQVERGCRLPKIIVRPIR